MGRFSRKFKKALGNESVDSILNAGRSIKAVKNFVLQDRKIRSKQQFVNNNLDRVPLNYSKELLDIASANTNNNIDTDNNTNIVDINADINENNENDEND